MITSMVCFCCHHNYRVPIFIVVLAEILKRLAVAYRLIIDQKNDATIHILDQGFKGHKINMHALMYMRVQEKVMRLLKILHGAVDCI